MKNKQAHILIVDDEPDILALLQFHFEDKWQITISNSPVKALELAKEKDFFLIITDLAMPIMDGYNFITALLDAGYKNEIAVMTGFGYNPNHTLVKINKKKKYPLFFKPFDFEDGKIEATIEAAYQKTFPQKN